MGHFSVEIYAPPGSTLSANQHLALALSGFVAGAINAVAGGGPILTLGAMVALGVDPRIANLTSTVALSPGQILAGWMARTRGAVSQGRAGGGVVLLCVAGGAVGAALLLQTPSTGFRAAVPWLVLFATGIYAWKALAAEKRVHGNLRNNSYAVLLALMAIYGGNFGAETAFWCLPCSLHRE